LAFFDFLKRKDKGVRKNEPRVLDNRHQTRRIAPADPAALPHVPGPQIHDRGMGRETVVVPSPAPQPVHEPKVPSPRSSPPQPAPGTSATSDARTVVIGPNDLRMGGVLGVLVAIDGEFEGEVYKVRDGENKIGRGDDCEVRIPGASVSRAHAVLTHTKGMFAIQPASEGGPTLVNNDRITSVSQLSDGATIKIGQTTLKFRTVA
jgi:hypothetical protein